MGSAASNAEIVSLPAPEVPMHLRLARVAAVMLALVCGVALGACGGEDHKHMDHSKGSGTPK